MPRRNKAESITVDEVVKRLDYLHMNEMANRLKELDDSGELTSCTPLDIVNDLATSQEIATSNNIVARYKKQAKFYYPFADLADVIPKAERHINMPLVERLESGEYIKNGRNVLIISETGGGKTFFGCAFGNRACEQQYKVCYFNMIDFLDECRAAQNKGKYVKFLRKTANMNLIILDDFMLTSIDQKDAEYLYRLFNSQPRKSTARSFIICSQLKKEGMYEKLSLVSPALADAIMNRVVSRAYELTIEGPSMREVDIPEELKKMRGEKTN